MSDFRIACEGPRHPEGLPIGKNTVNQLEGDLTEPRPPTLRKLARALEVDPAELVRDA